MPYVPNWFISPAFDQATDNKYKKFVREITGNPENNHPEPFEEKLNAFYPAPEVTNPMPLDTLSDLLQTNFVVGEYHQDRAPKNFLIQNMAKLKEAGYTMLFLEHLYYDDQQELDEYDPSTPSNAIANKKIEGRLEVLDRGFGIPPTAAKNHDGHCQESDYLAGNNFLDLVRAAKQFGIRVVGIDTEYTYSEQYNHQHMEYAYGGPTGIPQDSYRIKSMNYTAAKIIEKEMKEHPGKWFGLTGSSHCYTSKEFSGVPQLTGAKTVLIRSESALGAVKTHFNGVFKQEERTSFWDRNPKLIDIPYDAEVTTPKNRPFIAIDAGVPIQKSPLEIVTHPKNIIEKDDKNERLVEEFQKRCATQITRLDTLPKLFNNPHALKKKEILESAKEILANQKLNVKERMTQFREMLHQNRIELITPHSSIPKDIMKGILVFVAAIFFVIPGVLLGVYFFSPNRVTTTEKQIIKPLNDLVAESQCRESLPALTAEANVSLVQACSLVAVR